MFRAIQGHQLHSRSIVQNIYRRPKVAVHAAWVCHKAHTLSLQFLEAAVAKHLDAGLHHRACRCEIHTCQSGHNGQDNEQFSHIRTEVSLKVDYLSGKEDIVRLLVGDEEYIRTVYGHDLEVDFRTHRCQTDHHAGDCRSLGT